MMSQGFIKAFARGEHPQQRDAYIARHLAIQDLLPGDRNDLSRGGQKLRRGSQLRRKPPQDNETQKGENAIAER
jgi:hypothetical protein